jgi:beta-lactamase class A
MKLLAHKKSLGILAFSMIATNAFTYYYANKKNNLETEEVSNTDGNATASYKVKRISGYNFIKPILVVDEQYESNHLNPIKQNLTNLIENYKKIGVINSASIYIKEFNGNGWTGINTEEKFMPGSLMKVPELIAYLKMNEIKPGTLDKVILFDKMESIDRKTNFNSKSIQLGHKYTVRELLKYMISYSDNNATALLNNNIDLEIFKKVFTDLNLPAPDWGAKTYPITAREFSVFMRALYNGTYLNDENSEIATKLLSQCDFKEGMLAGLPANTKVAHKFGESGTPQEQQLSESAIIYLNDNPYAITIMTKGKDYKQLPKIIKEISNAAYQFMQQNAVAAN